MTPQIFAKSITNKQDVLPENVFWNQIPYPGESKTQLTTKQEVLGRTNSPLSFHYKLSI
jgi:hypothetical protein